MTTIADIVRPPVLAAWLLARFWPRLPLVGALGVIARDLPLKTSIAAAVFLGVSPAVAQDEPEPPDPVEVRHDFTLHLGQIDVMVPRDPTELVAGITDQFLGGETILAEVRLKEPIAVADLEAMARERGSAAFSFRCGRVALYEAGDTHLVGGDDCEMVEEQ